jgi:NitT/TauT family transport system substrate-binding protein
VRSDFAQKYPELVVAYLKATLEADQLLREDPEGLSEKLAGWTGVDAEVYYAFHGPHGIQTRDYSLKPEFVGAIAQAQKTLLVLKKVEQPIAIEEYVTDRFIRQAARELGLDYDARLRDYQAQPFRGDALDTHAPVQDAAAAGQLWLRGEPKVRLYSNIESTFRALREAKDVRVTFVHDRNSGNKLFADKAWYVQDASGLSAFLSKDAAQAWAKSKAGSVLDYASALRTVP